jgi:hypothetical protein
MRRVLLSACAGLALAGFVSVDPASAAGIRTESLSNGQGGTTDIVVIRMTLEELYGSFPQGFAPVQGAKPEGFRNGGFAGLPITIRGQGYYGATLYWAQERREGNEWYGYQVPKVALKFYQSYDLAEVLALGPIDVGLNTPNGTPFIDENGNAIVNPITLTPSEVVSPTGTGGFGA